MTNATCRAPNADEIEKLESLKEGLTQLKEVFKEGSMRPLHAREPAFSAGAAALPTQHKITIQVSAISKKSGFSSSAEVARGTGEGDPIPDELIFFEGALTDTHPFSETLLVKAGEKIWIANSSPKPPTLTLEVAAGLSVKQDDPQLFIVTSSGSLKLTAPFSGESVGSSEVPYSFEVIIDRSDLT